MCITYLFSTALASGAFQKKCGLVCLFSNLGAFFSPETMYVFSICRSISQGLQQLSSVRRTSSFCLLGTYHSLTSSAVPVPNPPSWATQVFSFLIHPLNSIFSEPKSSAMHPYSRCGGHSLPLIASVALLWLSSSAVTFEQGEARPAHTIQDVGCSLLTTHLVLQSLCCSP